jgi:TolA-binding protein
MLRKIGVGVIPIALLVLLVISGCSDNREQAVAEEKAEYMTKVGDLLSELDGKIAELRMQATEASEETAEDIQHQLDQLTEAREGLHDYLDNLRETTADNWQTFKNELDQKMADVRRNIGDDETISG